MLRVLVVEDDEQQRSKLVRILKNLEMDFEIMEAATGRDAINKLHHYKIDLFFLDIQLPDVSGIKIAEVIRSIPHYTLTYMVFITTHMYYQLDAFKTFHCYDFIEKPYKSEDVRMITERLINGLMEQNKIKTESICFELKHCFVKVLLSDILYIESQKRDCIVHTRNKTILLPNVTMKEVMSKINKDYIIQSHKSYIVNLQNIVSIKKADRNSWSIHFEGYEAVAYVSNNFKENLTGLLSINMSG